MRINSEYRLALILALLVAVSASPLHPQNLAKQPQNAPHGESIDKPSKHSGPLPKADFGRPSPESPAKLIQRQKREASHRNFFPLIADPGRFVQGSQETVGLMIIDEVYVGTGERFPGALDATAILLATVKKGQGFVSQDRTYVYTDLEVTIDEVLKQDPGTQLSASQNVVVSRPGATVQFPSGHVKKYMVMGRGMPKVGAQYVFFLWKPSPDFSEYEILNGGGFELDDGFVRPLDERSSHFEGVDAKVFLNDLRKAIGNLRD
jgi:hypothetical protein